MPEHEPPTSDFDWRLTTFEGSRREQLRRWAQLPLENILLAIEEMQDIARLLGTVPAGEHGEPARDLTVKEPSVGYGKSGAQHDLELPGCTPEPLMAYLKALGILRLVNEQTKDSEVCGWWKNDVFWLRAPGLFKDAATEDAKRDALLKFFLEEYKPTPIVAPWAGGSGFFKKDNKKAVEELRKNESARVQIYAKVIQKVQMILKEEGIGDKPKDEEKTRLINRYRRELPDEVVDWMDAATVLQQDRQDFSPLLGTGGNDGRLDFTQNFMQRIVMLGLHNNGQQSDQSRAWLAQTLFLSPAQLVSASVGQFAPGRVGGPNATQGMEGGSINNPWEFMLLLEGALMLAGAAMRRFGAIGKSRATFPFTVRAVAAGFDSPAPKDEPESRGELWLPLWTRPTSTDELRQLFGEGRAEVSGRSARDGTDFARAIAELGVDRGIAGFSRLGFLKRSGKAFLATPLGRFAVVERPGADLLREVTPWLDDFRWMCARGRDKEEAPKRILSTLNGIDSAILDFCKYGGKYLFQNIVVALGRAECELSVTEGKFKRKVVNPIRTLSAAWVAAANDGCREFTIARALASLHDTEDKIGPLRTNLEAVNWKKRCCVWAEKNCSVVWNAADVATNLANVLQRRLMDGQRTGCQRLPLASRFAVPLDTVAAFLNHELDDQRIADLIWGLMLIDDGGSQSTDHQKTNHLPLPRVYALLKLLFLPRPLVANRVNGGLRWRLARNGEEGFIIRPEPRILPLLRAGRVGEACCIAAQRLRASGLAPMPGPLSGGKTRDYSWAEYSVDHRRAQRLSAALLIPIDSHTINDLVHVVCRDQSPAGASLVPTTEGEFA